MTKRVKKRERQREMKEKVLRGRNEIESKIETDKRKPLLEKHVGNQKSKQICREGYLIKKIT